MKQIFVLFVSLILTGCFTKDKYTVVIDDAKLSEKNIKIKFGLSAFSINRETDAILFDGKNNFSIIYANGQKLSKIKGDYGENDFLILYNEAFYTVFRVLKTSRDDEYEYKFTFEKKNGDIYLNVSVNGQHLKSLKMGLIENASKQKIGD